MTPNLSLTTVDNAVTNLTRTRRGTDHWPLRAIAWQLVAAVAATVAEYAMRLTLWAQERADARRGTDLEITVLRNGVPVWNGPIASTAEEER